MAGQPAMDRPRSGRSRRGGRRRRGGGGGNRDGMPASGQPAAPRSDRQDGGGSGESGAQGWGPLPMRGARAGDELDAAPGPQRLASQRGTSRCSHAAHSTQRAAIAQSRTAATACAARAAAGAAPRLVRRCVVVSAHVVPPAGDPSRDAID